MRGPDRQPVAVKNIGRRSFLFTAAGIVIGTRRARAQSAVTRPVVSEKACPLETIGTRRLSQHGQAAMAVGRDRSIWNWSASNRCERARSDEMSVAAAAARQSATRALELGRGGREVDYAAAFALALAGDLPQSRALAEVLAREFPEDTSVQFMYLPALRALFSLNTPSTVRPPRRSSILSWSPCASRGTRRCLRPA